VGGFLKRRDEGKTGVCRVKKKVYTFSTREREGSFLEKNKRKRKRDTISKDGKRRGEKPKSSKVLRKGDCFLPQ